MSERPIFVPSLDESGLVKTLSFHFVPSPDFALVQKRKNIEVLHGAAASV
jgi:predicted Fe-Mo cluster-binding NifX family protein